MYAKAFGADGKEIKFKMIPRFKMAGFLRGRSKYYGHPVVNIEPEDEPDQLLSFFMDDFNKHKFADMPIGEHVHLDFAIHKAPIFIKNARAYNEVFLTIFDAK